MMKYNYDGVLCSELKRQSDGLQDGAGATVAPQKQRLRPLHNEHMYLSERTFSTLRGVLDSVFPSICLGYRRMAPAIWRFD